MKRLALVVALVTLGCGGSPDLQPTWRDADEPAAARSTEAADPALAGGAPVASLTLAQALARLDAGHPELAASRGLVEAAEGRAEQAGLLPNPLLNLRVENAPWSSGSTRDQAEYVAGLTLLLPVSGRLGAAEEVGARDVDRRLQALAARRLELHAQARGAFATALSLERAAAVQAQTVDLATRAVELLQARVRAGDAVPADLARVEIEATRARLEQQRVQSLRQQALVALATALGDPGLPVTSLAGDLEETLELPALEDLVARLERNPRLKAAQAEVALQAARLELAKTERVPDVVLDLFYRRLEESDQHAFDVGVGIPLPIFDRNQGAIRSLRAEQLAATARAEATRNELVREVRSAHLRLGRALFAAGVLREELLPRAQTVLDSAEARFAAGDASLVEVLPIRRDWASLQLDYVDALREVMVAWSDLQALTAAPGSHPRSP